jgi:L-fuconolactonase
MSERTPRRAFLQQTAAAGGAVAAGLTTGTILTSSAPAEAAKKKGTRMASGSGIPIVDTHQHLWDLKKFKLPWLGGLPKLAKDFVMKDYFEATSGLNVVKTVYMEVDVDPSQQVAEAEYVIDLCRRDDNPMVAAVISGRPASPGFKDYITRYKGSPYIKGVRQVLHGDSTPPRFCLEREFIEGIRLLGELGMSFDICMRGPEMADAVRLVDACPGTRFILDHCGNPGVQTKDPTEWRRGIVDLAKRKHVICKVSGIIASANPDHWKPEDLAPFINHVLHEFGPNRVIFGGDWPVCTLTASYRQWVEALHTVIRSMSEGDQRKLFHDNAVRFYGIG